MKILFTCVLVATGLLSQAQSLSNENLAHLYDPQDEIDFQFLMVKQGTKITLNFSLQVTKEAPTELYLMEWEERSSYSQRQGNLIKSDSVLLKGDEEKQGEIEVSLKDEPWLLSLKITKVTASKSWVYPFLIEKNYPVNGFLSTDGAKVLNHYIQTDKTYTIEGPSGKASLYAYYYPKIFPSAFPPFSKNVAGADPLLLHDSTFTVANGSTIRFPKDGLYLFQSDTSSSEGFAFRVTAGSFPKYRRIEDLVEPLVFICTRDEFAKLQSANADKTTFDKTVLEITRDRDRARRFMKSYYNQIELANLYFTSYKEGWKTDMGMIYIIFGTPDEVRKTAQNEIWYYKNSRTKFVFIRKGSVYDPNYSVLMRDDRFTELWYNSIDLWRKSRF